MVIKVPGNFEGFFCAIDVVSDKLKANRINILFIFLKRVIKSSLHPLPAFAIVHQYADNRGRSVQYFG